VPGVNDSVEHPEFGSGVIKLILGNIARVNFFGEEIDVSLNDLTVKKSYTPEVPDNSEPLESNIDRPLFRQAFEAINLGVVPPDPSQLIELTIGYKTLKGQVHSWFQSAGKDGLCKVVFGYYGSGKTHLLNVIRCIALQSGWVVSFLEFDPKSADPAKPHLVYRNLMSCLEFPERENGTKTEGLLGFIKEIRNCWDSKSIRRRKYFSSSPWFSHAFEILLKYPHLDEDYDYVAACSWLAGDNKALSIVKEMGRAKGYHHSIPRMPVTKETADIYVNHLVVISELCRVLGYKGLVIILDEAEHVRGYNVRRKNRANNFFDLLARSAHKPLVGEPCPLPNEHGFSLQPYWSEGPHFALFVGLTEADTFNNPLLTLRDACVFLHDEDDRIFIKPPTVKKYEEWCTELLKKFHKHYPTETELLSKTNNCKKVAAVLGNFMKEMDKNMIVLRIWIKLAGLIPCIILSKNASTIDELSTIISSVASEVTGSKLPWEM
jgi:hypothetical protein